MNFFDQNQRTLAVAAIQTLALSGQKDSLPDKDAMRSTVEKLRNHSALTCYTKTDYLIMKAGLTHIRQVMSADSQQASRSMQDLAAIEEALRICQQFLLK